MSTIALKVQGMTCNHCVMRVSQALRSVSGVQDARVDLQKEEAVVSFDESRVTKDEIATAVAKAGYKVVP